MICLEGKSTSPSLEGMGESALRTAPNTLGAKLRKKERGEAAKVASQVEDQELPPAQSRLL